MSDKPWEEIFVTKEDVESLWEKFDEIKDTAEQHDFPLIYTIDIRYTPLYNDLTNNWDDYHAKLFVYGLSRMLEPFGVEPVGR